MDNSNEKTDEVIKVYKRPLWLNLFLDAFFLAFGVVFAVEAVKAEADEAAELLSGIAGKIKEARDNPLAAPVLKQAEALFGDLFTKLEEYAQ